MKNLFLIYILLLPCIFAGEHQVLGLGSPCIDYILCVQEEDLARWNLQKGRQMEIDERALSLLMGTYTKKLIFTGNCVSNTIKGLACLGIPCALTGNVSKDFLGFYIRKAFEQLNIKTFFTETATPTSQIACLITPDGERSFYAFIEAEKEISEFDLSPDYFEGTRLVHMEGFRLFNGTYLEKSMRMARQAGATISFDIANADIAKKFRERIFSILESYTDILFLNKEEAFALTHLPPDKSALFLKNFCPLIIVKVGDEGCWICSNAGLFHSPAIPTKVIDTTGAGDLFASAFLYGYLNGYSLKACAYFGNLVGSAAVENFGAELPPSKWEEIRQLIMNYQN